jgi:hypothetical protein
MIMENKIKGGIEYHRKERKEGFSARIRPSVKHLAEIACQSKHKMKLSSIIEQLIMADLGITEDMVEAFRHSKKRRK